MSNKIRNFVFTLNNPSSVEEAELQSLDCKYIVYGREVGEHGTHHLQGYIELANPRSFSALSKLFPWHIEKRRGTAVQASSYCKKDGDFYENGTISNPGARNDLKALVDDCKERRLSREDFFQEYAKTYARYPRFCQEVNDHYHPPTTLEALDFRWYVGPTGTGKSRTARTEFPDAYIKSVNKWWDDYSSQSAVIIDEWSPTVSHGLQHLLKIWADHYPFRAEVKGGSIMIRPSTIIITSNYTIDDCFLDSRILEPLQRRFTVRHFFSEMAD